MDYKYKIYPISQLDSIDWSKFTHTPETCRKSLDGTQFIVRFAVEPHGNTIVLTHEEAYALIQTPEWMEENEEE